MRKLSTLYGSHFFCLWVWPSMSLTQWRKRQYILKMFCLLEKHTQDHTWPLAFWVLAQSPEFDCYELATKAWPNQAFGFKTKGHFSYLKKRWSALRWWWVPRFVFCLILSNPTGVLRRNLTPQGSSFLDTLAKSPLWNHWCGFDFRRAGDTGIFSSHGIFMEKHGIFQIGVMEKMPSGYTFVKARQ